MSTQSIVPSHYDINYITEKLAQAGVTNHYGHGTVDGGLLIVYRAQDFDAVQVVLDAYPVSYADDVLRLKMMSDLAALRWQKQQGFLFNGSPMKSDPETISSLTATVLLMDVNPDSPQTRRWKVGPSTWQTFDRNTLVAIGTAAAAHIQLCFDREEELMEQLLAAETVNDLLEIDILEGWPS